MAKRVVVTLGVVLGLALVALWRFGLDNGVTKATAQVQAPPPEVPVTAGVVATQDVPRLLRGIGTVQAFNTVAVKSQVDGQIVKVPLPRARRSQGRSVLPDRPSALPGGLERATTAKEKDEAQLATAQVDLVRYSKLVGSGFQTRQSFEEQQGRSRSSRRAVKGDKAQIDTARLNLDIPTFARLSMAVPAPAWSISATSCGSRTTRRWFRSPS